MKLTDLATIRSIDKILLNEESKLSQQRGESKPDDTAERRIEIMQRKGNLGMNAILSVSLAMSRLIANMKGKDLWELIREEACSVIIETAGRMLTKDNMKRIAGNPDVAGIISKNDAMKNVYDKKGMFSAEDAASMKYEDLMKLMRIIELCLKAMRKENSEGYKLYALLRDVTGIYSGN